MRFCIAIPIVKAEANATSLVNATLSMSTLVPEPDAARDHCIIAPGTVAMKTKCARGGPEELRRQWECQGNDKASPEQKTIQTRPSSHVCVCNKANYASCRQHSWTEVTSPLSRQAKWKGTGPRHFGRTCHGMQRIVIQWNVTSCHVMQWNVMQRKIQRGQVRR